MKRDLNAELSQQRVFLEGLKKDIDSINAKVNEFFRQIEALRERPDVPAEFINFKTEISNRLYELKIASGHHKDSFSKVSNHAFLLQGSIDAVRDLTTDAHNRITSQKIAREDGDRQLKEFCDKELTAAFSMISAFKQSIQKQLDDFKSSLHASPASITESNAQVAKSLSEATRGLQNAMQRIQNSFDVMGALEVRIKKLEAKQCPSTK